MFLRFFLAGVVRIELTPEESEASVLPLHHTPTFDCYSTIPYVSKSSVFMQLAVFSLPFAPLKIPPLSTLR